MLWVASCLPRLPVAVHPELRGVIERRQYQKPPPGYYDRAPRLLLRCVKIDDELVGQKNKF